MTASTSPWVPGQEEPARWSSLSLPSLISRPGGDPDQVALVFEGDRRTYQELSVRATRFAEALVRVLNVEPGERVALTSRNCLEYLEVEIAVASAGGILVAISWRYTDAERIEVLQRSGATVAVTSGEFVEELTQARRQGELPHLKAIISLGTNPYADAEYDELILRNLPTSQPLPATRLDDPHEIIYTSGTTGRPKGAVWTQGAVLWNSVQQAMDFNIRPTNTTYVSFDLNYIGGRHQFTWALLHQGGTVHLRRSGGFDAREVLAYLCQHRISHVLWVPTMLYDVLGLADLGDFDTSSLEMIMCGGAPLSEETVRRAQQAFPHTRVVQVFGLTEGGGTVSFVPPQHLKRKVGSAGKASLHNELRIMGEDGLGCQAGTVGEILVRGPAMTTGYWDDPVATAEAIQDGWLRTGDLGYLDDEGFLYISGRRKELIISGGMNIFPSEVEDALRAHPAVRDVAVVGVPHARWGETVCAVVELVPGRSVDQDELIAFSRQRLASYKKPTLVRFTSALPRTLSGKVRKVELRNMVIGSDLTL